MKTQPLAALVIALAAWSVSARDITFISTSDSHYRQPDHKLGHHNHLTRASVEEMNRIETLEWPAGLGGGKIARPIGVIMPGDLIDDGDHALKGRNLTAEQFRLFEADFGLDGTDGLLDYPVFEGFGNHDGPPEGAEKNGFSVQREIKRRNRIRLEKGLISNVSENGLHYSWDWDDVHFLQLNIYPADRQREGVRYSPVWHAPQGALTFLKQDLATTVGGSGRPVVLAAHCGFDTNWWTAADWEELHQAIQPYRVILYLFGHTGTGTGAWAPAGASRKLPWINDGQTNKGFFVIRITDDRLVAAYRLKTGLSSAKQPDGRQVHEWNGDWDWKFPINQPLASPPPRE